MLHTRRSPTTRKKLLGYSTFPECQVTITASEQAYTRFANNGITTASFNLRNTVSIVSTRDGRSGSYGVNDLDDASLRAAVQKSEELAADRAARSGATAVAGTAEPTPIRTITMKPRRWPARRK